jgi:hypothetical protein
MLVTVILMLMIAGVVEVGFVLNNYLHVFDAAREAARYSSSDRPFEANGVSRKDFYTNSMNQALRTMYPVTLRGKPPYFGDLVISVFSLSGSHADRYPDSDGWSLCENHTDPDVLDALPSTIIAPQFLEDFDGCTPKPSKFTNSELLARIDPAAPASGVLLVEIFYAQDQILDLPVFSDFLPNPVPIYVYSVMPISAAEPTSTP